MIYHAPDWCHHGGIPRPTPPPDDAVTDLAAWVTGAFDTLAATPFTLEGEAADA